MDYAIIAAGEGARLAEEGSLLPKPLVKLNGVALIDRLIDIFMQNKAEQIHVIINESAIELKKHLTEKQKILPLKILVRTTSDSLHSFAALLPQIESEEVCLTTVDSVFKEEEFTAFIQFFKSATNLDGMAAVTTFIDDEKPLYVETANNLDITGFKDHNELKTCKYISGGIYCLRRKTFASVTGTLKDGKSKMRDFQRRMVLDGMKLKAWNFSKIIDVDHIHDIQTAENMLLETHNNETLIRNNIHDITGRNKKERGIFA